MKSRLLGAVCACLFVSTFPTPAISVAYELVDLGTLNGFAHSQGRGINDSRQVVGFGGDNQNYGTAFLWDSVNGMQDLGMLGGSSQAFKVNNRGQVVGNSQTTSSFFSNHAYIWDSTNGMQDLGTLGENQSHGHGINESGQVVGFTSSSNGTPGEDPVYHAYIWDSTNGMQDLGTLYTGTDAIAESINDRGQVVGWSNILPNGGGARAFLWDSTNGMQDINPLLGNQSSRAEDINNSGQVVGRLTMSGSLGHVSFLWDSTNGGQILGFDWAQAINDSGQVVGHDGDGIRSALLWDSTNGIQDLCALTDCTGNGWTRLETAYDINSRGDIVGYGYIDGTPHAFLSKVVVPIPPALWLFGSGLLGLVGIARRKKAA